MTDKSKLKIIAVDKQTGDRYEIDDLYWFEEMGVHGWDGEAHYAKFWFEVYVGDKLMHSTKEMK